MSGAQAGGFIGGIIGSYFGPIGGYIGSAFGSYIGGVIDPTIYKGPSIGDAQQQASTTGIAIPKVYGHCAPIAPTLIDGDKVARKVKHTQDVGKGATQKTETEGFVATRFFLVCENADGTARIARITRNGKLVYSAIAGDALDADSAAFLGQFTEYTGGATQGPDPSLEAIHGIGNTPYYRKRLCFIVRDDDETQTQGMANQYRVEVISSGTATECGDGPLFYWPLAGDARELIQGKDGVIGGSPGSGSPLNAVGSGSLTLASTSDYMLDHQADIFRMSQTQDRTISVWCTPESESGGSVYKNIATLFSDPDTGNCNFSFQLRDGVNNMTPVFHWNTDGTNTANLSASTPLGVGETAKLTVTYKYSGAGAIGTVKFFVNDDLVDSVVTSSGPGWSGSDLAVGGWAYPGSYGFIGSVSDLTIWDRAFTDQEVVDSYVNLDDYLPVPDVSGAYVGPDGTVGGVCRATITPDAVLWKDVALDIAGRASNLLPSRLHVETMTDEVPGFVLGNATLTATDYLRTLCTYYFTDLVEKDGGIHAIRRGGAVQATITDDDLLAVEEEDDNTKGQQSIEGWQRVTVIYPDPANNYVPSSQTALRSSPDVLASSEVNLECPFPFDADTAKQKADILQKIRDMQVEGGFKRALPAEFSKYIPSDPIVFNDRRHIITKASNDDSAVRWECAYDRASAYVSSAKGSQAPPPTPQISNIKGPTIFKAMNSPALSSTMDKPGVLIAARGRLPGWVGANLKLSLDGGETYSSVLTLQRQAVMGTLVSSVSANSDALSVRLWSEDVLETASAAQLAANKNFFTVVTNDVMDIGQFQNASEDSNGYFDLSTISWGQIGTTAAAHNRSDTFVLLDEATLYFLPIDISFAGRTLWFWPITLGTAEDLNQKYSLVYNPMITGATSFDFYVDHLGGKYTNADGAFYYKATS